MMSGSTGIKKFFGLEKENILSYILSLPTVPAKMYMTLISAKDFIGRW